jgi:hypothetical protein
MSIRIASAMALSCLILTACAGPKSMVHTRGVSTGQDFSDLDGLSYYLPMRYAQVTFERAELDSPAAQALRGAKAAEEAARVALDAAERSHSRAIAMLRELQAAKVAEASPIYQAALTEAARARADLSVKTDALGAARAATISAQANRDAFNLAQGMCGFEDRFEIELLGYVPDPAQRYTLRHNGSRLRHDKLDLKTTGSGLLSTVDGIADDQSAEVLINLANSVVSVPFLDPASTLATASMDDGRKLAPPLQINLCRVQAWRALRVRATINPADEIAWGHLVERVNAAASVQMGTSFDYKIALKNAVIDSSLPQCATETACAGVLYRRERPVIVEISRGGAKPAEQTPIQSFVLTVPNGQPTDLISLDAMAFARNESKLGFENGMLTSFYADRPSPALEVVSVPWKIAEATADILNDLLTLRVDYTKSQGDVATNQVALLNQMRALIQAETELEAARRAAANPAPTPETPAQADPSGE